jgi:hypothetical protein
MEDRYIYVFVRQDLTVPQQLVHSNHAVYHMATGYDWCRGTPAIVVIGIPNLKSLNRVAEKMRKENIDCYMWLDPDVNMGTLAIATVPLDLEKRAALSNYRLYSLGAEQSACSVTADKGATPA